MAKLGPGGAASGHKPAKGGRIGVPKSQSSNSTSSGLAPAEVSLNLSFCLPLTEGNEFPGEYSELPRSLPFGQPFPKQAERERKSKNLCWERAGGLTGLQKGLERSLSLACGSLQGLEDFRETGRG